MLPIRAGRSARWIAVYLLAGCSAFDGGEVPICPQVTVLSDTATLTRFVPGQQGRDLTDVDYNVAISDVLSGCKYIGDLEDNDRAAIVAVAPVIIATRGPANKDHEARFEYFVTLVTERRDIVQKQLFDVALAFPGNRSRVEFRDDDPPITIEIPVSRSRSATDYQILVGLQVSTEELEYNRRARGTGR